MNFVVKEYDPIEDALQQFLKFNATPADQREISEQQLVRRVSAQIANEPR